MKVKFGKTSGIFFILPTIVVDTAPEAGSWQIAAVWMLRQICFTFGA